MKHYDYIFTGVGLAALMTVNQMIKSGKFADKSILLLDADSKQKNDRTWCFWEKGKGNWDKILTQQWKQVWFRNEVFSRRLDLDPYEYKMIRGIDFYNKTLKRIMLHSNITFRNENVTGHSESAGHVVVQTDSGNYSCSKLFNSIYDPTAVLKQTKYPLLQQHFIGWTIKTETPSFDPNVATFMDFSVPQKGNTRFMYVLPVSDTEAIFEYTLFSKDLLPESEYEEAIVNYLSNLDVTNYKIIDKERGRIPMTSYEFWESNTKNVINIGSAGGWTKASTGFTFKNSDKLSKRLVQFLQQQNDFTDFYKKDRFWFYDLLLLDILSKQNEKGAPIFSAMFKKSTPALVLKFLDGETSFWEDLKVIWQCPKGLFIKALFFRLF
ncbi:MAG: lycopene cyclase [Flavobacterium sp. BFFFF1]|uniref:lycopene cyclase family protein n=1 Tax=Flavobacterium sp. BFFFF1 TaxID=2015557 RepID=UPI000BCA3602|nr:lycopene cyclase family protein [Flavobacterium sp. BFFFF1]OYU80983.1 MAG: lycopene cyclase [Flavobacterium sp. BFFFF1]